MTCLDAVERGVCKVGDKVISCKRVWRRRGGSVDEAGENGEMEKSVLGLEAQVFANQRQICVLTQRSCK